MVLGGYSQQINAGDRDSNSQSPAYKPRVKTHSLPVNTHTHLSQATICMSLSYLETVVVVVVVVVVVDDALPEPVACLTVVDQVAVAAADLGAVNQEMPHLLGPSPLPWAVVVVVVVVTSAVESVGTAAVSSGGTEPVLPLALRQIWSI